MSHIYHYLGAIVFWSAVGLTILLIFDYLGLLWNKIKERTWAYQIYEVWKINQVIKTNTKNNFINVDWTFLSALITEYTTEMKHHLFRRYILNKLRELAQYERWCKSIHSEEELGEEFSIFNSETCQDNQQAV